MATERLQVRIKDGDYERFKNYAQDNRARGLAFINALFKIRNENHIQCVVIGDVGQGKSTTATKLSMYDTKFTRALLKIEKPKEFLKYGDKIHFNLLNHVIISPKDPASKFVKNPKPYNSYESDEGYLWATTSDANTRGTKEFIESIIQNRKMHPSFYHVYQNLFKMPSRVLELMNEVLMKIYVNKGALLIPTRMVQLAEKFDRATIEKYAKNPRTFEKRIKYHAAFVSMIKTPNWSDKFHEKYLEKYQKYKISETNDEKKKTDVETQLFNSVDKLVAQKVIEVKSKADIQQLLKNSLASSKKLTQGTLDQMSTLLTERYISYKENQAMNILSGQFQSALAGKLKFNKLKELIDAENGEENENIEGE